MTQGAAHWMMLGHQSFATGLYTGVEVHETLTAHQLGSELIDSVVVSALSILLSLTPIACGGAACCASSKVASP
jgi:hypothetical protein